MDEGKEQDVVAGQGLGLGLAGGGGGGVGEGQGLGMGGVGAGRDRGTGGRPISPEEIVAVKTRLIPGFVFDAFNELIARDWDGVEATVKQDEVVKLIRAKQGAKDGVVQGGDRRSGGGGEGVGGGGRRSGGGGMKDPFAEGWLDVEEIYRGIGWTVRYEKPGYNEEGMAFFVFSKGTSGRSRGR